MRIFQGLLPLGWGLIPAFGRPGTVADELEPEEPELPPDEAHVGPLMVLESNVTVPAACTNRRPSKVAPVFIALTPLSAKILPMKEVVVSRVTELPILHHTLQGSPPVTEDPGDVISVETVLKIQTPEPVRFKFPLNVKLLVEQ